ncbi:DUF1211 domain-containing protein [Sediminibacterium roseum]|uniref:DUF1211 domain-containing protein n=1 Tax=Sediminibacterium roseum TaxID=1978412 RepID=A0ABW9ZRJ6_9BACT|nr:TMEM175 family protein [Sediminibacterium roseum]NCI49721.1 DUF1211 domain-containing protein [Sediminibacterium roseum]
MGKGRLEAFSDGVLAIIITIMVLEMKVPHDDSMEELVKIGPVFMSYVLSFVYIGIYWNNHHHLMHAAQKISGGAMWANNHLLFWLSLMPFASGWMGENHFTKWPVVVYGVILFMNSISYYILVLCLLKANGKGSTLAKALGSDLKGKISTAIYAVGIAAAFLHTWISLALYAVVAIIWLIPDRRIERTIEQG